MRWMIILNHSKYIKASETLTVPWSLLFNQTGKMFHSSVTKWELLLPDLPFGFPSVFQSDISFFFALFLSDKKMPIVIPDLSVYSIMLPKIQVCQIYRFVDNVQYGVFLLSSAMIYCDHAIARWECFSLLHTMRNWFTLITCAGLCSVPCDLLQYIGGHVGVCH